MSFPFPMFVPSAVEEAAVLTSLVYQSSSTTSGGETITVPADVQAGDLLVLSDLAIFTDFVTPDGFSVAAQLTNGADVWTQFSFKIADGSEASGTLTGMSSGFESWKILVVLRPNVPLSSASPSLFNGQMTNSNPSPQIVAASGAAAPLIVFGIYFGDGVNPRTLTVGGVSAKDDEVAHGTSMYVAWKFFASSPADVTVDMDDEGNGNVLQSGYLTLTT